MVSLDFKTEGKLCTSATYSNKDWVEITSLISTLQYFKDKGDKNSQQIYLDLWGFLL